jgi:hypothetical protein
LREDIFFPDPQHVSATRHVTVIVDAVTLTYHFIDQETKDVRTIELGRIVQERVAGKPQPGLSTLEYPLPTSQPLPIGAEAMPSERFIEGVPCRGSVVCEPSGTMIESWSSGSLGFTFPVLEITRAKDLNILYRLFNIQLDEPDSSLFVLSSPAR